MNDTLGFDNTPDFYHSMYGPCLSTKKKIKKRKINLRLD